MDAEKSIVDRITDTLSSVCAGRRAVDVRLGLRYVCVRLDNGNCGLAYRFPERQGCDDFALPVRIPLGPEDGHITGREAAELLSWIQRDNLLPRAVGLATANALIGSPGGDVVPGDIRSILELREAEDVVMIGYFEPLVQSISDRCNLQIYEIDTSRAPDLNEATDANKGLASCNVALITSTAIINGTMDHLLRAAASCREVAILGPSTPLLHEAFRGTPVTLLSGVVVADDEAALRVVSEGGGMRQFKPYVRKVNVRL